MYLSSWEGAPTLFADCYKTVENYSDLLKKSLIFISFWFLFLNSVYRMVYNHPLWGLRGNEQGYSRAQLTQIICLQLIVIACFRNGEINRQSIRVRDIRSPPLQVLECYLKKITQPVVKGVTVLFCFLLSALWSAIYLYIIFLRNLIWIGCLAILKLVAGSQNISERERLDCFDGYPAFHSSEIISQAYLGEKNREFQQPDPVAFIECILFIYPIPHC